MTERFDVIVLGAGAAGMFAAMRAGQRGHRVLLLDHADEPGKKILISGGGRCNFTNMHCAPDRFISDNPHFAKSALAQYTAADFIALVRKHGIAFHEKTLGQLFCDGSARAIVRMLLDECAAAGVELRVGQRVGAVTRGSEFTVETQRGVVTAPALILATGGLSIPKMGATDFSLRIARQFGLPVVAPRPALVPFAFDGALLELMQPLAGVSLPITAAIGKRRFEEAMLFTHRGLSGPAILQISSYWQGGEVALNLAPDGAAALLRAKREQPRVQPQTALGAFLPARLAQALAAAHLPARPMADVPDRALNALGAMLREWRVTPSGTEGYAKAEVMAGGVDTRALNQRNCQARDVPGLFVIGEAVDVTGWLGGYNFQWAWASGWVAGGSA